MLQNSKIMKAAALLSIAMVAADASKQDAPVDHEQLLDMKILALKQKQEDSVSGSTMEVRQNGSAIEEWKIKKEKKERRLQDVAGLKGKGLYKYTRKYNRKKDAKAHPDFYKAMQEQGGNIPWRSYGVVTEDNYVLRMFRILGHLNKRKRAKKFKQEKGPLLLIHGFSTDSITWMSQSDTDALTLASQLFEDGYDVWFANMRGSRRSRRHTSMDPDSAEDDYWEFDLTDMADDVKAMIDRIRRARNKEDSECQKVTIIAHSLGTLNTVTALSNATKAQDYISQVVLMEPCMISNPSAFLTSLGDISYPVLEAIFSGFGIKSAFGPNWEVQKQGLCSLLTAEQCAGLNLIDLHDEEDNWGGTQEISIKVGLHLLQNAQQQEFQEFADNFNIGLTDAPDYDLESITSEVPIRVIFAEQDMLCPSESQLPFLERIQSYDQDPVYVEGGHGTSSYSNDDEFMTKLKSLLDEQGAKMTDDVCTGDFAW